MVGRRLNRRARPLHQQLGLVISLIATATRCSLHIAVITLSQPSWPRSARGVSLFRGITTTILVALMAIGVEISASRSTAQEPPSPTPRSAMTATQLPDTQTPTVSPTASFTPTATPTQETVAGRQTSPREDESRALAWDNSAIVSAGLLGLLGAGGALTLIVRYVLNGREMATARRLDAQRAALEELYEPLYRDVSVSPPLHTLTELVDAEVEELSRYLGRAGNLIKAKFICAESDLLDHSGRWDAMIMRRERDQMVAEALWLYQHVEDQFHFLRKKIGLV